MSDNLPSLDVDGPHSPANTMAVADLLAETVRVLNYATQSKAGLDHPADVYDITGSLHTAMQRLPQLCDQLARWITAQHAGGRLGLDGGGDVSPAIAQALKALDAASGAAVMAKLGFQTAQNALSPVHTSPKP